MPEVYSDTLKQQESSCHFILNIMEGLIDVSKLSMDKFEGRNQWFSIHDTINEVFGMLEYLEKLHNTKMSWVIPSSKEIFSDSTRIKQILINLMSNSLKFTIDGDIVVRVNYEETFPKGNSKSTDSSEISNQNRFEF